MKLFISYSHTDSELAANLANDLLACGIDVWLDSFKVHAGDCIPSRVSEGLASADYIVLLMSRKAMKSKWVEQEWLPAIHKEIVRRRLILIPARIDNCKVPMILAHKLFADFRQSYVQGLAELTAAFYDRLIDEYSEQLGIVDSLSNLPYLLTKLIAAVAEKPVANVVPIMNTILHGNRYDQSPEPLWLKGSWAPTKGWNHGSVLTFTEKPHMVGSANSYMEATGSFGGSLTEGCIGWAREIHEGVIIYRWVQEIGGTMDGAKFDRGFGFWLADSLHQHLVGLWWYEPHDNWFRDRDPRANAYLWELVRDGPA